MHSASDSLVYFWITLLVTKYYMMVDHSTVFNELTVCVQSPHNIANYWKQQPVILLAVFFTSAWMAIEIMFFL